MQRLRDVLRESLARTLAPLDEEDRLAAAWPVACGPALAAHGELLRLEPGSGGGVLHVRVTSGEWHSQFLDVRSQLTAELARIAGVRLSAIHFEASAAGRGRVVKPGGGSAAARGKRREGS